MKGGRFLAPLLLLVLAALLRWFPGASLSLGVDDGVSILTASSPLPEIFPRMLATHEVHPPLWFYWLHPWFAVLSPGAFESGGLEPWFRSSNVLWSLLVVYLTFALGERLGGRRVGLAAGLLAAVSNYLVFYALELRMYPMLTAFLLGAALAAVAGARVPLIVCCLLAFLSHYEAVFFIAALGLFCLTEPAGERRRWLLPAAILAAVLALWTPVVLRQAAGQAFTLRDTPSWPQAVEMLFELGFGVTWPSPLPGWDPADGALPLVKWCGLLVLLLLAVGLRRSPPRARRLLAIMLALPAVAVFAISIFTSVRIFEYKYLQPTCPFVCLALAMWVRGREDGEGRAVDGFAVVAIVVAVNVAACIGFVRNADWYGPQDWRDVVPRITRSLAPGEVVLVHPSMMASPVLVYAVLGQRGLFTSTGESRVVPSDAADAPQMLAALAAAPRALLLTTLAHPFVAQERLLERLPAPWKARFLGATSSYWPANRIQIFELTRQAR